MDPQTIERAIKRCIDISTRLAALEDEIPPRLARKLLRLPFTTLSRRAPEPPRRSQARR